MKCPYCGEEDLPVVETIGYLSDLVPRARKCRACGQMVFTTERVDTPETFKRRAAAFMEGHQR